MLGALLRGKATAVPQTWDRFSNDSCYRQDKDQETEEVEEEQEDEWAALRNAAAGQDLRFSVSHGWIYVGRAEFTDDEDGVNEAWEYIAS